MSLPIQPDVFNSADGLGRTFQTNQPFSHLVIPNFLEPAFCQELLTQFPAFDEKKALNEMGLVGGKAVQERLEQIGPAYGKFDQTIRSAEFLELFSRITGIPNLLYDPEYVGGGTHENRHGQDLDVHVDFNYHPRLRLHRRLNLILFLNPEWREEWGGCLQLHKNPWLPPEEDEVVTTLALMNYAVVFETTETSWHGFERIQLPADRRNLSRKSIAVYFYTAERPAEQTAPHHSTVYVPRHLPDHIRAGYTLTKADEQRIRDLINRRDAQIRFLYEREKEFSEAMHETQQVLSSKSFRLMQTVLWPLHKTQQILRRP
jgi:hypothetical protein